MDSVKTAPRDFLVVTVPKHLRYSPEHPPKFTLFLNVILAIATTVLVANIYYCQPILIQLSQSFGVSLDDVSNAATLLQSGYAAGIMFITPLGDIVRRRALVLNLSVLSMALTFGLAFTRSFVAFQILSFFIGVVTCVPQVLMPLTADLAPPERRAFALSVTLSGLKFGMVYARVVAGLIANFVSWRIVYYLAIGIQALLIVMLYFLLPDFPVRNTGVSYGRILLSMGRFAVTEPLLIQASIICFATMACFTNFWVTLTFLLGGPPYNYSTVVIGLFGLVGLFGVVAAPFVGKLVDGLVPWYATLVSTAALIVFQAIQTGAGGVNIAAVVIVSCGLDVFRQMQQVSLTTAVFGIDPAARSRLNAVVLISVFAGQIMGTAAGTQVFVRYGWRPAAALSLGWHGFTLLVLLLRGPHCARYTWFGYEGGLETRKSRVKKVPAPAAPAKEETSSEDAESKEKSVDGGPEKSV